MSRELRLLELLLKHHAAITNRRRILDDHTERRYARRALDSSSDLRRTRRSAGASQPIQMLRSALAIGMVTVGMFTIYLIVANL